MKKLGYISIGLTVFSAFFFSCSEEVILDELKTESVSISFSVDPITKAEGENGSVDAEPQEVQIKNYYVGIFKDSNGEPSGLITNYSEERISKDNGGVISVNDLIVPTGEPVHILVIANSPDISKYKGYTSYQEFSNVVYAEYSNLVGDLIKVGQTEHTFTDDNTTAKVDLKQLTSKIRVKLYLQEEGNTTAVWQFSPAPKVSVSGIMLQSPLIINDAETSTVTEPTTKDTELSCTLTGNEIGFGFYTFQKKDMAKAPITVTVNGNLLNTKTGQSVSNVTYKIVINRNSVVSTDGILAGGYYEATGTLKVSPNVDATVEWVVVELEKVEDVEIPPFE